MLLSLVSGLPLRSKDEVSLPIEKTICISGHREKSIIPFRNNISYAEITGRITRCMLYRYLDMAAEHGYEWFISGLATGTDLWAAEYLARKKMTDDRIHILGAMPYLRHSARFGREELRRLDFVERNCDILVCVNPDANAEYHRYFNPDLYRDRNYFMVDNASAVVAFLNEGGRGSGTSQTVGYARRRGRTVRSFSSSDVHRIMEESVSCDDMLRNIAELDNVFDMPF